jgi:glycosyltransferase involved in cell wall biosynthesis
MRASVIIPTFNRRDTVLSTIQSVLEQNYARSDYEVIIVVDGGTDDTEQALRKFDTESRLRVLVQENRGLPGARNSGFRVASGELLIFLDDDMICTREWLRAHVAAHQLSSGRETVGLGAIYIPADHPSRLAAETFRLGQGAEFLRHRDNPDRLWPANVWSFANTSITRRLLESVGGFDERFRMREDCELGTRLLKAGMRQQFVADAVAYQRCDKTSEELVRDAERFAEYDLLFLKKHPGWMPHDFITRIRQEAPWKRSARHWLSRNLEFSDAILAPLCAMGNFRQMPRTFRRLALRALLLRCGLHWYRRMRDISGVLPEKLTE